MALTKTEKIIIVGDCVTLVLAIGSFFFPQLADLRKELWGIFIGYNSALMLALKTDSSPEPLISGTATLQPYQSLPYMPNSPGAYPGSTFYNASGLGPLNTTCAGQGFQAANTANVAASITQYTEPVAPPVEPV
jgi:hypothetical protein